MQMIIEENWKKIIAEKALLFGCATDKGFFKRLITKFLPILKNDSFVGNLIHEWEKREELEATLREQAYKELALAFLQIKKVIKRLKKKVQKFLLIETEK